MTSGDATPTAATATRCPACRGVVERELLSISVSQAADHLVPPRRSPARHQALSAALSALWADTNARVLECERCGFGFAWPFIAGDAAIYNLVGGGHQHYPGDRYEFGVTVRALSRRGSRCRMLELGAGAGAFLSRAIAAGVAGDITALEYDDSAIRRLRALPRTTVVATDVQQFARTRPGPFDAICLFQVLEHLDRLDEVFAALRSLIASDGEVFIAVPNHERLAVQERLTSFLDMPPIHIGRWTKDALTAIAVRHDLEVLEHRTSDEGRLLGLWGLAKYRTEHLTRRQVGVASRVEAIGARPVRGLAKRIMAAGHFLTLAPHLPDVPPEVAWFRLGPTGIT